MKLLCEYKSDKNWGLLVWKKIYRGQNCHFYILIHDTNMYSTLTK